MTLQYYDCKVCTDAAGTDERFQYQIIVPFFSEDEYALNKEIYATSFGEGSQTGVFNFETGTMTPALQYINRCYALDQLRVPSVPNELCISEPYDTFDYIFKLHKYSISFKGLPITSEDDHFTYRHFYLKNNNTVYGPFAYREYKNSEDQYRVAEIYDSLPFGVEYGSGTGYNNIDQMYLQVPVFFIVSGTENKVKLLNINGYVRYSVYFGWSGIENVFPENDQGSRSYTDLLINGSHTEYSGDPLEPGGTSETGGGDGDFSSDELDLDFPDDPALSAVGTGMVSLFSPTTAQLQALANYLWSTDFDLDLFKKMFAAPLDAILGLSIVPVAVPTSGAVQLKFGGWPTTVSMNKTNKQWVTVDCGSVNVGKYWGSALDYNPYTKVSIFLPYIGMRELDTDEVMGKTITVQYKVDILSGACVAMVKCGGAVLYQFAGSCAVQVPVSNRDWSSVIGAAVSFGTGAIAAAATGGASAVGTAAVALNTASAVMSAKVNVSHTGSVGGSSGFMGIQNPYILIKRARQSRPTNYNKIEGYPSNIYETIGNLRGFTQIEKMHLENIPATTNELDELESLMMEGVII